jgi:hypothetical protein
VRLHWIVPVKTFVTRVVVKMPVDSSLVETMHCVNQRTTLLIVSVFLGPKGILQLHVFLVSLTLGG